MFIVEFVGASGSGKTTLLRETQRALQARGTHAHASPDAIADWTRTAWVRNPALRHLFHDVLLRGWARRFLEAHPDLLRIARATIAQQSLSALDRVSRSRALTRQAGGHALIAARAAPRSVMLVDEGILGSVHAVLVHPRVPPRDLPFAVYAALLPMPDLVVHMDVAPEVCLARTHARPDPPLRGHMREHLDAFVRHGHEAFEALAEIHAADPRWLRVAAGDGGASSMRELADTVAERVVNATQVARARGRAF